MTIRIIGAGMAGLLAANMLRSKEVEIYEASPGLPNNHQALLRFRSGAVSDATGISFKKVNVVKDVYTSHRTKLAAMISYSLKVNGKPSLRSIGTAFDAIAPQERYIAPPDFINRMAWSLKPINFNHHVNIDDILQWLSNGDQIISTLPMNILAMILNDNKSKFYNFKRSIFESRTGTVIKAYFPEDWNVYATLYFPDAISIPYRASINGNELIIECAEEIDFQDDETRALVIVQGVASFFGIKTDKLKKEITINKQRYAKILAIDENERKEFIIKATNQWKIYSLGRFATWRPGLLLDDVVNDVRVINNIMNGDNSKIYEERKNAQS